MLLDNHTKQSPIVGVAGLGGGINSYIFLSSGSDYVISRSLRFNDNDSAYLSRTPSSASDRQKWTWAAWVKKTSLTTNNTLFSADASNSDFVTIRFESDTIRFDCQGDGQSRVQVTTTSVYRDPSAWYHIVIALDTTQGTAADRCKIYINNILQTTSNTITQNKNFVVNSTVNHEIGRRSDGNDHYFDGYLADVHLVDGQQLTPTSFGNTDDNGVWQPKKFSGSHGTNGFHLDFKDNSSNAALGYDTAGSNNFTVNNLTATVPGLATANQGFDVVTYTGNGGTQSISSLSFQPDFVWIKQRNNAGANMLFDSVRGATKRLVSNQNLSEGTVQGVTSFNSNGFTLGDDADCNMNTKTHVAWAWKAGDAASSNSDGTITSSVSANNTYGFSVATFTTPSSGTFSFGHGLSTAPKLVIVKARNQAYSWSVYAEPIGNAKYLVLDTSAAEATGAIWNNTTPTSTVVHGNSSNFGTSTNYVAYSWSEVAGFSKLSSYTGTGGSKAVTGLGFKPKYVLMKSSTKATSWMIADSKRGDNQILRAHTNDVETTESISFSFDVDGFSFNTSNDNFNESGQTYIYAAYAAKPDESIVDSLIDSPSQSVADETDTGLGGEITGNYATYNPVRPGSGTKSNGNLTVTGTGQVPDVASIAPNSGKWYAEIKWDSGSYARVGLQDVNIATSDFGNAVGQSYRYESNSGNVQPGGQTYSTYAAGDIIGVAFDCDAGKLWLAKNGTWQNSGNPAGGTGAVATNLVAGKHYAPASSSGSNSSVFTLNAGQRAFFYTAPTGFKALCTSNLPTPTIADGSKYFDTKLWTGTGSSQSITGYNFSPDFAWIKSRSGAYVHYLVDTVRGAQKRLSSNNTNAEATNAQSLTAFNSDGFSLGNEQVVNENNSTFVGWAWDAGTSTVTNNDGSIASQVRAQPSAGFSIVSFTASGSAGSDSCGHGLNAVPGMVIIKRRDASDNWFTWHSSFSNAQRNFILLDSTAAITLSTNDSWGAGMTSSVIGFRSQGTAAGNMIAYCFAPVEGYSAALSWTGNGSSDGVFVHTGFKVAWMLWKRSDGTANWYIYDSARNTYNVVNDNLEPNTSDAENTLTSMNVDFLSNGIKIRGSDGDINGSGGTYIGFAFAEHPFKTARAR